MSKQIEGQDEKKQPNYVVLGLGVILLLIVGVALVAIFSNMGKVEIVERPRPVLYVTERQVCDVINFGDNTPVKGICEGEKGNLSAWEMIPFDLGAVVELTAPQSPEQ